MIAGMPGKHCKAIHNKDDMNNQKAMPSGRLSFKLSIDLLRPSIKHSMAIEAIKPFIAQKIALLLPNNNGAITISKVSKIRAIFSKSPSSILSHHSTAELNLCHLEIDNVNKIACAIA